MGNLTVAVAQCSVAPNKSTIGLSLGPDKVGRGTPGRVGHLAVGPVVLHHQVDVDVHQGLVSLHNVMQWVVTSLNSFISKM